MDSSRRHFLASAAIASMAPAGSLAADFKPPSCQKYSPTKGLIIDVHCHLLNVRDVDRSAFVQRRVLEVDENFDVVKAAFAQLAKGVYGLGYGNTFKMRPELDYISANQVRWVHTPESFCLQDSSSKGARMVFGSQYQLGDVGQKSNNPLGGFFAGRLANAVRLEEEFPSVDLFTPSMVDFYEGNINRYAESDTMSVLYERISQATFGRIMPLVSFNPQRAVDMAGSREQDTPMWLVKKCIDDRNFLGVKLHPSVGYGPTKNASHACPNGAWQRRLSAEQYRQQYGAKLDQVLWDLFTYCADNEVPILTHGSPGIPANKACMMPKDHEKDWLYAPKHWAEVLSALKKRNPAKPLRVCLGHFAGTFSEARYWTPWLEGLLEAMSSHSTLYTDISIQRGLFKSRKENHMELREQFTKVFEDNPVLAKQALYGTDWHMPELAELGGTYLATIQELVPASMRDNVFGLNAVEFLGLRQGRMSRARIDKYQQWLGNQTPARVPAGYMPPWMVKVDALKA